MNDKAGKHNLHRNLQWVLEEVEDAGAAVLDLPETFPGLIKETFLRKLLTEKNAHAIWEWLEEKRSGFLLVDVRQRERYVEGHVPTAISMPLNEIDDRYKEIEDHHQIILYCASAYCRLGVKAALRFAEKGVYVREMSTGWQEWVEWGYPVEKG